MKFVDLFVTGSYQDGASHIRVCAVCAEKLIGAGWSAIGFAVEPSRDCDECGVKPPTK